ncbi:UrcA family protein [Sphingobium sp. AR-3-1]|uniref:UrcA family protein n=1 Tax=Sphingobium psychrophilum TaxID=2728834 RepID=A0A7X9WVT6_9SPHN|nr:UrcA family protein [Sphingobium psychrophilum]NML10498.1 UrcA family protein [Sphingobium psychrophilum]
MTKKTWVAMAAAIAVALPGVASAGSNDMDVIVDGRAGTETRSLAVSVADLNLTSTNGMRRADSRVTRAAKQVCGFVNGSVLPVTEDYRNCFGSAIDGARNDLSTLAQRQS